MNAKAAEIAAKDKLTLDDLLTVMSLLRAEDGCPWDREQTHKSIRRELLEETYEVAEAIDNDDNILLREELGDLLFQVVFHAQIAKEDGAFFFDDVVNDVTRKMIVRHPHIFGEVKVNSVGDVLDNWDEIKKQTKEQKSLSETMDSVAKTLPALMRAAKLSSKAAKKGVAFTPAENSTPEQTVGDMLFAAAAAAHAMGIDPEKALSDSCDRFISAVAEKESR
ncbi:MAG: MazG family protein [Clostridia bacterium]|nr:MazG family protein [Clostridia bacterium]